MSIHEEEYTLELRKVSYEMASDQFVIMKRGGLAHLVDTGNIRRKLEEFTVSNERAQVLVSLVRHSCAVRYYEKSGKVVALFDRERWHPDYDKIDVE